MKQKKNLSISAAINATKMPRKLTRGEYDELSYDGRLDYVRARVAGRADFSAFGNEELLRYFERSPEEFSHPEQDPWLGKSLVHN